MKNFKNTTKLTTYWFLINSKFCFRYNKKTINPRDLKYLQNIYKTVCYNGYSFQKIFCAIYRKLTIFLSFFSIFILKDAVTIAITFTHSNISPDLIVLLYFIHKQ